MGFNDKTAGIIEEVKRRFGSNHFSQFLGLELVEAKDGVCRVVLPISDNHRQNLGFVHGGILATIADVAMGFAASSLCDNDHHVLTGELKISYLNPAKGDRLEAKGFSIKSGRKLIFTEAEIWSHSEDSPALLCAKASASMVVVSKADVQPKA